MRQLPDFTIKLAGVPIRVTGLHEPGRDFFKYYLCDEQPLVSINITQSDIDNDGQETIAIFRRAAAELLKYNVLVFHGSAVVYGGRAYLFAAKSGVGKTTHTRLWLKNIPGSYVLNGDKPLLKFTDEGVFVCGSPWQGKENMGCSGIVPLEAVCLLERGAINEICPVSFREALIPLLNQVHIPGEIPGAVEDSLKLFGKLSDINVFRLRCNMEDSAALVSFSGMNPDAKEARHR